MKEYVPEQERCLVQYLGLKEARTLFENEATWTAHCGMSSIHHQQWCVGRMHGFAAKDCSWVMIHSTSFVVPGLSHMLDHSYYFFGSSFFSLSYSVFMKSSESCFPISVLLVVPRTYCPLTECRYPRTSCHPLTSLSFET